jgi:hypothetical protein
MMDWAAPEVRAAQDAASREGSNGPIPVVDPPACLDGFTAIPGSARRWSFGGDGLVVLIAQPASARLLRSYCRHYGKRRASPSEALLRRSITQPGCAASQLEPTSEASITRLLIASIALLPMAFGAHML